MNGNLRTGWRDGRHAGDFARNFVFNEIQPTANEPAGTNRPDHRCGGDTVTEFTAGEDEINLQAVIVIFGN